MMPPPAAPSAADPAALLRRLALARAERSTWEPHWQECYDFALPNGKPFNNTPVAGDRRVDRVYDGTAPDGVEQLAAALLAQLTPPGSDWFGFVPGTEPSSDDGFSKDLERAAARAREQFDRSNFVVEIHQAFLDLVTAGTACLLVEEAAPGESSALRFTAVPLAELVLEEGTSGRLDTTWRVTETTVASLRARFPDATPPDEMIRAERDDAERTFPLIEAALPDDAGWRWIALTDAGAEPTIISEGRFAQSPFINFRWLKAPGETYGRSPVMKALPDIKTANKVVELVLKNASIAVTGIWQAEDDGVLNPANIRLVPGTIIPKAAGSSGLTPLAAPGRFDVSNLVLDDLRARIRHALLADRLAPVTDTRMTATEVLERSAETARILGATFGRLQAELIRPLIARAVSILRRRGEIPDIRLDGRSAGLRIRSPLARAQGGRDVEATLLWLESLKDLGPEALAVVDVTRTARRLAEAYGVPPDSLRDPDEREDAR